MNLKKSIILTYTGSIKLRKKSHQNRSLFQSRRVVGRGNDYSKVNYHSVVRQPINGDCEQTLTRWPIILLTELVLWKVNYLLKLVIFGQVASGLRQWCGFGIRWDVSLATIMTSCFCFGNDLMWSVDLNVNLCW